MSYARFSAESDVYVYHHYMGWIECCACNITPVEQGENVGFFRAYTAREILDHLGMHSMIGESIPERCFARIREEYPDLDAPIEEYKQEK
jgi:hypothetical protein